MFDILGFICVGDKTSCGGTVITGSNNDFDASGRRISRIGDSIGCRHNCKIITGHDTIIVAGQRVAVHGSLTTKQCICLATATNNVTGVGQTREQMESIPRTRDTGIAFMPEMRASAEERHWIEVSLRNKQGIPFAGEEYVIVDPQGSRYTGRLDGEGYARIEDVAPGECEVTFPSLSFSANIKSCRK
ncbi:MAG: PAAR domain-containing protein [Aquabacterium sp.]|nr:PAAR domain-containing protein [Aquabacterium sp.]